MDKKPAALYVVPHPAASYIGRAALAVYQGEKLIGDFYVDDPNSWSWAFYKPKEERLELEPAVKKLLKLYGILL